jgi:hypothetical protein
MNRPLRATQDFAAKQVLTGAACMQIRTHEQTVHKDRFLHVRSHLFMTFFRTLDSFIMCR